MGNRLVQMAGIALIAMLAACGGKSKGDTTPKGGGGDTDATKVPKIDPTLCDTKGKKVKTFDLNRDNKPDVWKLYKNLEEGGATLEILSCKQVDLDHDGRKDYVVGYNKQGAMVFEKFDFDFDGRFDAFAKFDEKSGQIAEVERDSDFDGKYDLRETYDTQGIIKSVKRDRNGDKDPDVWEQYEGGNLVAILYDDDFDGKVDRRDEVKKPKKQQTMPTPTDDATESDLTPEDLKNES